eukprot:646497-Pleurochrysis_carterae.AAC.1
MVRAETLLSDSDGVLPAVLCFGGRTGELGRTLRVLGLPATLSPHGDTPLAEAVELRAAGSHPRVPSLAQALEMLGVDWMPLDGAAEDGATQLVAGPDGAEASAADFNYAQALRGLGETEATAWGRAGLLCTIGVLPPLDSTRLPARDVAHFIAAAGGDQAAADAVNRAMDAAMARGDLAAPTHEDAATAAVGA